MFFSKQVKDHKRSILLTPMVEDKLIYVLPMTA